MQGRGLVKNQIYATISDYLAGDVTLDEACALHSLQSHAFYKWVEYYNADESKDLKGFPIMAEKLEEALEKKQRKPYTRVFLDMPQRLQVYEAIKAGGNKKAVAERFGISPSTAYNIIIELSALPLKQADAPVVTAEKLVEASNIGIFFEGDMVVLRIPKTYFVKNLLKGLI